MNDKQIIFQGVLGENYKLAPYNLVPGTLYFAFSSLNNIEEIVIDNLNLNNSNIDIAVVNSDQCLEFNIQVPDYFENNYTGVGAERMGLYSKLKFTIENVFGEKDLIIVNTAGLDHDSIKKLTAFLLDLVSLNPSKLIIILQKNVIGVEYPKLEIEEFNGARISNFNEWFSRKGKKTERPNFKITPP